MNWNDTKDVPLDTGTTAQTVAPASVAPWDRDWASHAIPDAPRTVTKTPTSSQQTQSGEWDQINARYAQGADSRSQSQLAILEQELAKETNLKFIASLKREISRVKGK